MAIGVAPAGGADTRGGSSAPKLLEKTIAAPHPIVTSAGAITHSPTARCQLYMRASVDRGDPGRSAVRHWPRAGPASTAPSPRLDRITTPPQVGLLPGEERVWTPLEIT